MDKRMKLFNIYIYMLMDIPSVRFSIYLQGNLKLKFMLIQKEGKYERKSYILYVAVLNSARNINIL